MDDLAACADLCESHGFAAPAAALRALAEGKAPFYLVRAMIEDEFHAEGFAAADIAPPTRRIFRDRAAAERYAQALTIRALRNYRPDLRHGPPAASSASRFERQVGAILGTAYHLPGGGGLLFPGSATDEQLERLGQLLYFTLFDVAEFGTDPVEQD